MKKKIVAELMAILALTTVISGCGSSESEQNREREKSNTENSSVVEQNITEESVETVPETDITNTNSKEEMLRSILEADIKDKEIVSFICDDYDNDGNYEAFALVGTVIPGDEYFPESYEGDVYFINEKGSKIIKEGSMEFANSGEVLDFGQRKYFIIEESYTTSYVTYIYSASNGDYMEDPYSAVGDLGKINGNDFTIMISAYDGVYDKEMDSYLGHTWKDYYFHYSEEEDSIKEYEGELISVEEAKALIPDGVIEDVINQGNEINNVILRENGILNINYTYEDEESVVFGNVNYDTVNQKYVEPWGDPADNWLASNYGGIYTRTIYTD